MRALPQPRHEADVVAAAIAIAADDDDGPLHAKWQPREGMNDGVNGGRSRRESAEKDGGRRQQ